MILSSVSLQRGNCFVATLAHCTEERENPSTATSTFVVQYIDVHVHVQYLYSCLQLHYYNNVYVHTFAGEGLVMVTRPGTPGGRWRWPHSVGARLSASEGVVRMEEKMVNVHCIHA